ncbi:hypothetical protein AB0442_41765, partial [Kitasatospora sp. NPDC085895]|uniref:hypothetical protein n=1 Tax=Kitasatospora sp. NPDC085895 TaxID=3155057 RepID=UPI00344DFBFC
MAHDDEIQVLPGERVLLAGFSGAALIDFGPPAADVVTEPAPAARCNTGDLGCFPPGRAGFGWLDQRDGGDVGSG